MTMTRSEAHWLTAWLLGMAALGGGLAGLDATGGGNDDNDAHAHA